MKTKMIGLFGAAMMAVFGGACATDPEPDPFEIEQRLVAAGFTYIVADTPEKRKRLQQLPQTRLIEYQRQGDGTMYLFADPDGCNCVYVGDETAYRRYLELISEQMATRQRLRNTDPAGRSGTDAASYLDSLSSGTWKPWW